MSDFLPSNGYASLRIVEGYWHALRSGREMPRRAEIDPRGIESALEFAFILERVAPGVARLRIAGSHLHDIMGMEARGMPLTSFFAQDARVRVADILEEVFQTPATAHVTMRTTPTPLQPTLEAQMILLPLKSDLGDVSRILGCMVSLGDLGETPRRFDLVGSEVQPLGAHTPNSGSAASGFQETQRPFKRSASPTHTGARADNREWPPYLRLVKSDD